MRRILLAALLLALAAGTADARHRRHHGFFDLGFDRDRGERYGQRSDRYGRDDPGFGERYGRGRRDRQGRDYGRDNGRDSGRDDPMTGFGGVDRYRQARRGVDALVPADWQLQPPDPRWSGQRFLSPEGNAWLALYSAPADTEPRDAHLKKVAFVEGEELSYLRREPDWLVVSGHKGERIFYRKAVLACGGQRWRHVAFEYPADQKGGFDQLVTRAARVLDGDGEDCATPLRGPSEPPSPTATEPPAPPKAD
jgi:serine/threonine-protein kinase